MNPIFLKDAYKVSHWQQYPKGTELIFSNFTPRKSRVPGINHSVLFGLKYFIKHYLYREYSMFFFEDLFRAYQDKKRGGTIYKEKISKILGDDRFPDHINDLYNLGHLPIAIYALPEKSVVPCGVPALVMFNTRPEFYWVTNMLETLLSCTLWGSCTSATIAREYRLLLDRFAAETSDMPEFVDYQAHDFSMRGMFGVEAAMLSGSAHLQYFKGTDTIPAALFLEDYYNRPLEICSVPATEHSVMSAGGKQDELETFKRLITEVHPTGIISIVSDTWDLWKVVTEYLPALKNEIMARDGKVVIRPDSGDPADIICGNGLKLGSGETNSPQNKGLIECLWEIFGGTYNSKGFKQLDSHIGAIYGDSITLERATDILERLKNKGFSSTNIVFGVGSFTYQLNTRDTFGWAMKATYAEINGVGRPITKDPVTDDGTKKSHSGILKVIKDGDSFKVLQNQTWESFHEKDNELKLVFKDGTIYDI